MHAFPPWSGALPFRHGRPCNFRPQPLFWMRFESLVMNTVVRHAARSLALAWGQSVATVTTLR